MAVLTLNVESGVSIGDDFTISGMMSKNLFILLMAEILHHLGCMKAYK